ncbi:MAG: hypothetical protein ACYC7D_02250 [Nitrososphaerales archaeon]
MNRNRQAIKILLGLTILLGLATIYTINSIVPPLVVYSAAIILVIYFATLIALLQKWSTGVLVIPIILSIFTIVSVFSTTQHIHLIEEGYLPAIIIIVSGLILEGMLLIFSGLALWKRQ